MDWVKSISRHASSCPNPTLKRMKTLRKYTPTLYVWRNLSLSQMQWAGMLQWNLTWGGSDRRLPCGKESRMFPSIDQARKYLEPYGYTVAI